MRRPARGDTRPTVARPTGHPRARHVDAEDRRREGLTVHKHPRLLPRFLQDFRCPLVRPAGLARRRCVQLLSGQEFSHGQDLHGCAASARVEQGRIRRARTGHAVGDARRRCDGLARRPGAQDHPCGAEENPGRCVRRPCIRARPTWSFHAVLSAGLLEPLAGPSFYGSSSLNSGVRPRSNARP